MRLQKRRPNRTKLQLKAKKNRLAKRREENRKIQIEFNKAWANSPNAEAKEAARKERHANHIANCIAKKTEKKEQIKLHKPTGLVLKILDMPAKTLARHQKKRLKAWNLKLQREKYFK